MKTLKAAITTLTLLATTSFAWANGGVALTTGATYTNANHTTVWDPSNDVVGISYRDSVGFEFGVEKNYVDRWTVRVGYDFNLVSTPAMDVSIYGGMQTGQDTDLAPSTPGWEKNGYWSITGREVEGDLEFRMGFKVPGGKVELAASPSPEVFVNINDKRAFDSQIKLRLVFDVK